MPHQSQTRRRTCRAIAAALCLLALTAPATAGAQSVAVKYQRLVARERAVRQVSSPAPVLLRTIAKSYEAITRAHPSSGYADNALWQAAGLLALAYERSGDRRDRDRAADLLTWLRKEYPTGSLAKQAGPKLAALQPSASPVATAPAPAPPAAAPPATASPVTSPAVPTSPAPATRAATTPPARTAAASTRTTASTSATPAPPVRSVPLPPSAPATSVRNVTHTKLPRGDRLTIELTAEGSYATNRAGNPDRVILDLANATMAPAVMDRMALVSGTLVKSVNVTKNADETTRFTLEVVGAPRYSTFPLYNPFRLVLDVESEIALPTAAAPVSNSAMTFVGKSTTSSAMSPITEMPPAPATPASTSRGEYSLARQLGLGVSRIVIDPGHGGHDPGAQANGVTEAELVLDIATRVASLISEQPGFDVVLTRRRDEFIALEERTAIANRESADMFISIHANASPQPAARGIETYFLDFASNPQAEALAARENASSAQTMRLLPELVKQITLSNKLDESRELARSVQFSLVRRLAPQSSGLRDLGVKRAPFVVLIGAQMPSVLAEVSFLTNRTDANLLKQNVHRQRIAQAIADAVIKYRSSLKKVTTAAETAK